MWRQNNIEKNKQFENIPKIMLTDLKRCLPNGKWFSDSRRLITGKNNAEEFS